MGAVEYGGVQYGAETGFAKEMTKWQKPYRFEKFPMMLFKAQVQPVSGKHEVVMARDIISLDKTVVILSSEQFNASCQLIVHDEAELSRAREAGWRESPKAAMEHHEALEDEIAHAAAYRAAEDSKMSQKAQEEAQEIEGHGSKHVPEIPEQPKKARGWPKGKPRGKKVTPSLADA